MKHPSTYFKKFGISNAILKQYNVETEDIPDHPFSVIYPYTNGSRKICSPFGSKKWRVDTSGKTSLAQDVSAVLFGYDQLPETGETVILTGGEKDVLTFHSLEISAICLNSETASIPPKLIHELKSRFSNVLICYDTDETGIKQAKKFSKEHKIINLILPKDFEGKDISDFMASGRTKDDFYEILKSTLSNQNDTKPYYTGFDIYNLKVGNEDEIIKGILPSTNIVGLIGGSDVGKSLFTLHFSINYILGKDFMGFKVQGGKKVLFCSLEDDKKSLNKRLKKMMNGLSNEEKEVVKKNLFYSFNSDGNVKEDIFYYLDKHPDTGMVIIDPLGELMPGIDVNNFTQIREGMQFLSHISQKYNLLSIYIHHISKAAESSSQVDKKNTLGSQAIEAKSRVLIEMKSTKSGIIQIAIVKGNDIDSIFKAPNAGRILKLNKHSLLFKPVDRPFKNLKSITEKKEIDWCKVFGQNESMKTSEILSKLANLYGGSIKRHEKSLSKELGEYRLKVGLYQNPCGKKNEDPDLPDDVFQL